MSFAAKGKSTGMLGSERSCGRLGKDIRGCVPLLSWSIPKVGQSSTRNSLETILSYLAILQLGYWYFLLISLRFNPLIAFWRPLFIPF